MGDGFRIGAGWSVERRAGGVVAFVRWEHHNGGGGTPIRIEGPVVTADKWLEIVIAVSAYADADWQTRLLVQNEIGRIHHGLVRAVGDGDASE